MLRRDRIKLNWQIKQDLQISSSQKLKCTLLLARSLGQRESSFTSANAWRHCTLTLQLWTSVTNELLKRSQKTRENLGSSQHGEHPSSTPSKPWICRAIQQGCQLSRTKPWRIILLLPIVVLFEGSHLRLVNAGSLVGDRCT
jgi:hypothetical protein